MSAIAERHLANGARVLLIDRPGGLAAIHALFRAGSLYDPPGREGLSHCLEHMLFKGSRQTPGVAMTQRYTLLGALPQGETTPDETFFSLLVPRRNAGPAMAALAEMIGDPALDPGDLEREQQVIRGEIRGVRDDLRWWVVSELLPQAVFGGTWAGYPITGTPDSIAALTVADLRAYHQRHFHGGNLVLAVVAAEPETLWPEIAATFGQLPGGTAASPPALPSRGVVPHGRQVYQREAEMTALALGWRLPVVPEEDLPALDLAVSVLGEGSQSLIVAALREQQGMAYDAGAFRQRSLHADFAAVYAQVDPASVEPAVAVTRELVAALGRGVDDEAVAAVRAMAETAALEGSESSSNLASWYAVQALRGRRLESPVQRAERLRGITGAEVAAAARRYLDPDDFAYAQAGP